MWKNIYTRETISDNQYSKLSSIEKRKWRRKVEMRMSDNEEEMSIFSEHSHGTTIPSTSTWVDIGHIGSSNDNNWSNSTDFGGGDFGGGGAGGDW
jgi:uncharacterized membrane protein YgcG